MKDREMTAVGLGRHMTMKQSRLNDLDLGRVAIRKKTEINIYTIVF